MVAFTLALLLTQAPSWQEWEKSAEQDLLLSGLGRRHLDRRGGDNAGLINQLPYSIRAMLILRQIRPDRRWDEAIMARCESAITFSDRRHAGRIGWSMTRYSPNLIENPTLERPAIEGEPLLQEGFESGSQAWIRARSGRPVRHKKTEDRGFSMRLEQTQSLDVSLPARAGETILTLEVLASTLQTGLILDAPDGTRYEPLRDELSAPETWSRMAWAIPAGPAAELKLAPHQQEARATLWVDNLQLIEPIPGRIFGWSGGPRLSVGQSVEQGLSPLEGEFDAVVSLSGAGGAEAKVFDEGQQLIGSATGSRTIRLSFRGPAKLLRLSATTGSLKIERVEVRQAASTNAVFLLAAMAEAAYELKASQPAWSESILRFVQTAMQTHGRDWVEDGALGAYVYAQDGADRFPGSSLPMNMQAEALLANFFVAKGLDDRAGLDRVRRHASAIARAIQPWGWPYQQELLASRSTRVKALSRSADDDSHGDSVARAVWTLKGQSMGFGPAQESAVAAALLRFRRPEGWATSLDGSQVTSDRRPLLMSWLRCIPDKDLSAWNNDLAVWLPAASPAGWSALQKAEMARRLKGANSNLNRQ